MPKKKKQKKAKQDNKPYVIIAAVAVSVIGIAMFITSTNVTNQPSNANTISSANEIKLEALKLINSDSKKAKEMFQQALAIYQSSQDTNNIIDTESLIYLVDHKK